MEHTPPPTTKSLTRNAAIASLAIMGSRVLGLVREQIFAFYFGASRELDAYLTAFRIPNLLRDLFAEGALSTAFVAVFLDELRAGKAHAFRLANSVFNLLALWLSGLVALGLVFAPVLVAAMAVGFDADKLAYTVVLTRIMLPFILFVALAALYMGMLNSLNRYALAQSASSFFNLTSIVSGLLLAFALAPDYMGSPLAAKADPGVAQQAMIGMALGTLLGGLAQWAVQLPGLRALGYRWQPVLDVRDAGVRRIFSLMGPSVLAAAAVQVNVFINSNFASLLGDKQISWLNYAFRLMQLPIGVFGVAIMSVSLPALSRARREPGNGPLASVLSQALELVAALTLPAALGLAVFGQPIIRLLYQRGCFDSADTAATAAILALYAAGLPAYAALKILNPAFIALHDSKTPMRVSLVAVALNLILNYGFVVVLQLGILSLPLSTSLLAVLNVVSLVVILKTTHLPQLALRPLGLSILRILAASLLMVGAGIGLQRLLQEGSQQLWGVPWGHSLPSTLIELLIVISGCVASYAGLGAWLGIGPIVQAGEVVRRKLRRG